MIFLLYALISLSIAAFDQFFKFWVVANIPLGGHQDFLPGIVSLTHIHNTGAAFSMFENMRVFLLIITTLSIAVIIVYMVRAKLTVTARIALSMILGGAVGNAIDRIVNGYVVDMFDLDFMEYAIFNVADCFIVVGGVMFCLYYIIETLREEKTKRAGSESMADAEEISDGDIDDTKIAYPPRGHENGRTHHGTKKSGRVTSSTIPYEADFISDPEFQSMFENENNTPASDKPNGPNGILSPNPAAARRVAPTRTPAVSASPERKPEARTATSRVSSVSPASVTRAPAANTAAAKPAQETGEQASQAPQKRGTTRVKTTPFYNDNDDLSFTQKLDLEFNKLMNKNGNNKDQG